MAEESLKEGPLKNHPVLTQDEAWMGIARPKRLLRQLVNHAYRVCDYAAVSDNFQRFRDTIGSRGDVHFAVKASATPAVLKQLIAEDAGFEIATFSELMLLLENGFPPEKVGEKVFFGQTQKEPRDIEKALKRGLRVFATDNEHDIENILRAAAKEGVPASEINLHLRLFNAETERSGGGYSQSFNLRYGVSNDKAFELAELASSRGLKISGVTFHPGSGSKDPKLWSYGIEKAAELIKALKETGIEVTEINLSGGFDPSIDAEEYQKIFFSKIDAAFSAQGLPSPTVHTEPGRWIVANSEVIIGKVSNVKINEDGNRIVTLTTGVSENGTLTDLGLGFDYYQLTADGFVKLEDRSAIGNLHGRACADFDKMAVGTGIPEELNPDNPDVDKIVVVVSGAGAYSKFMERNFWCGIWPPVQMDFEEFCGITTRDVYESVVKANFGEKALLFIKGLVALKSGGVEVENVGKVTSTALAEILENPEQVAELGDALMEAVAKFIHERGSDEKTR